MVSGAADVCEAVGRRVAPSLAGVTITEAVKDVWAALPLLATTRPRALARRLVFAETALADVA